MDAGDHRSNKITTQILRSSLSAFKYLRKLTTGTLVTNIHLRCKESQHREKVKYCITDLVDKRRHLPPPSFLLQPLIQGSHRRGYYVFYVDLFNLEVILGNMLFLFKLEVNVFNLDIILHYFRLDAGRTDILIKQSNIVRINILETSKNKTLKQGWMLKSQSYCNFFYLKLQADVVPFTAVICFSDLVLCNKPPRWKVTPA